MALKFSGGAQPSEIQASFQKLSSAATSLNAASDKLSKIVENLNAALRTLNLGLESWVEFSHGCREGDDFYWSKDEIGYAKIDGKWGIALRVSHGDDRYPEEDKGRTYAFGDAPRELRIRAVDFIPRLIQRLNKDAETTTATIMEKIGDTENLANLVGKIAETLPSMKSSDPHETGGQR